MNKERIGRLILTATSPDTNVRLTHEEGVELGNETLAMLGENKRLRAIIDEVHSWAVCGAICPPVDMAHNLPHIVEITTPETEGTTDSQRVDWLLPVITGEVSHRANQRTGALGACLMCGLDGRAAVDRAMGVAK